MRPLLLLLPYLLLAQSPDPNQAKRVAAVAQREPFLRATKSAVIVGISDYPPETGMTQLKFAKADADAMAAALRAQGYSVRLLTDGRATRSLITSAVREAAQIADPSGAVLFFFSGHGFATSAAKNFLVTSGVTAEDVAKEGLSLEDLQAEMQRSPARQKMMFIDACRNEPGKSASARSFSDLQASSGLRVLLSTQSGKMSFENDSLKQGVFTHFLLRGMGGEAAGADGLVTFRDLSDFLASSVRRWSFEQGFTQVPVERSDEASGDFLLARANVAPVVPVPPPVVIPAGPKRGDVKTNPKDGQRYAFIPSGTFRMGCSEGDNQCLPSEKPTRDVTISKGFWLGQTEVTVEAYRRFASAVGRNLPDEPKFEDRPLNPGWANGKVPMVNVDWNDSSAYCTWIGGRLPTEAEWEFAARAETTGARYGDLSAIAWFGDNAGSSSLDTANIWDKDPKNYYKRLSNNQNTFHAVAQKGPNAFGLYDMLGNVSEWTSDWYGEGYYQGAERTDPNGPPNGENRSLRGGSCYNNPRYVRVSYRYWYSPGVRDFSVGFRCVGD